MLYPYLNSVWIWQYEIISFFCNIQFNLCLFQCWHHPVHAPWIRGQGHVPRMTWSWILGQSASVNLLWTGHEPIRGYKRVSGRGIEDLFHDGVHVNLRALENPEPKSQIYKTVTPTLVTMAPKKEPPDKYTFKGNPCPSQLLSRNIYCGKMPSGRSCPFHSYYCNFSETLPFSYDILWMNVRWTSCTYTLMWSKCHFCNINSLFSWFIKFCANLQCKGKSFSHNCCRVIWIFGNKYKW